MKAGKDVYCEKPMIHLYADGPEMIETSRATNRILQVGSQRVSSVIYAKKPKSCWPRAPSAN
jgi:predicted dehydrogenase